MPKVEFEFPEPDGAEVEVEAGKLEPLVDKPVGLLDAAEVEVIEEEVEEKAEDTPEIEIIDDIPPADRNRKPSDPPEDVSDEELHDYSEKVQKRIKHFSRGYHDERRAKEAAAREAEEARRFAAQLLEENKRLKNTNDQSRGAMLTQAKGQLGKDIATAQQNYKTAYDNGNADELLQAQETLTQARLRETQLQEIERRMALQRPNEGVQQNVTEQQRQTPAPIQPAAEPDERAKEWAGENTWFGQPGKDQMTALALGYHTELVNNGIDPSSNEYYGKLNSRMRAVFPEEFGDALNEPEEPTARSQKVAPATRSIAPRKVKLTQTQVNLAKRLGVPLEEYAKQVAELERNK